MIMNTKIGEFCLEVVRVWPGIPSVIEENSI